MPSISAQVIIIGAGLAGTSTAYSLALRGVSSLILEQSPQTAAGASGGLRAVFQPPLHKAQDPHSHLNCYGFELAEFRIAELHQRCTLTTWNRCGALQLPSSGKWKAALQDTSSLPTGSFTVDTGEASQIAGLEISSQALFHGRAGTVSPREICESQIKAFPDLIEVKYSSAVICLRRLTGAWESQVQDGTFLSEHIVLANAHTCVQLIADVPLPVEPVYGELMYVRPTAMSQTLRVPISFSRYILPVSDGVHVIGGSFLHGASDPRSFIEQASVMKKVFDLWLPGLDLRFDTPAGIWGAHRTSTHDRLPYVGPVNSCGGKLYLNVGHGSRGLTTSFLAGELIAEDILGNSAPSDHKRLLSPGRAPGPLSPPRT